MKEDSVSIQGFYSADDSTNRGFSNQYSFAWETLNSKVKELGIDELKNRSIDMQRFLKENGVTYNIYGDAGAKSRTWNLDLIPFIIHSSQWEKIELGMIQRAELFNMILSDLYGPQVLIKKGLLPMEIIYEHIGFLRECAGISAQPLVIYSADLAQNKAGEFWVMNDRTQSPSGAGYALENRMAMARIVPEFFNDLKVRKLSPFYNTLHQSLVSIAPHGNKNPRLVLLTPGPENETYFEHSFLSSHLGYTLVQGDDLMVKDDFVWLKTLGGLEKVDVILRRVDDLYCDPLELKEDSQLGVPGLLQVIRSGNIAMANPLGSSVIENPGLIPFLPAISKYILGQDLVLPSIASWWCGQTKELNYVLNNLAQLIIKKIYRVSSKRTTVDASLLSSLQLKQLKEQILAAPHLYVAQEKVDFSNSPCFTGDSIRGGRVLFRNYVVNAGGNFSVMHGGLTRTSLESDNIIISNQTGGFSKDTWILSDEFELSTGNFKDQELTPVENHNAEILPSRTAENLFWVGRYTERLVGNARFQRSVLQYIEEANNSNQEIQLELKRALLISLTNHTHCYPGFTPTFDFNDSTLVWNELNESLIDPQRLGSIAFNLKSFLRSIDAVRDYWSTDTWRVLREMEERWESNAGIKYKGHYKTITALDAMITSMMAFININRQSMIRGLGWTMLDAGRKLEQSLQLISLMEVMASPVKSQMVEHLLQEAVLKTNENLVSYRFKYRSHLNFKLVLQLFILDTENPRSLIFQLTKFKNNLLKIPSSKLETIEPEHILLINNLMNLLEELNTEHLAFKNSDSDRYEMLQQKLADLKHLLYNISDLISKFYFKHAVGQKQLFK